MDKPAVLTRTQIREVDRIAIEQFGIPGAVLMENAGRGIADYLCDVGIEGLVVILCGPGNNGGDGHVVARHLDLRGHDVVAVLACPVEKLSDDAKLNYEINKRLDLPMIQIENKAALSGAIESANWIVDGLLGTGASGPPREVIAGLIKTANQANANRLAIDIPSGLDCDTGNAPGAVFQAHHTACLAALKAGLVSDDVRKFVGVLSVLDIGVPQRLIQMAQT
jgi:NAD(P)H-hydrate epimerase